MAEHTEEPWVVPIDQGFHSTKGIRIHGSGGRPNLIATTFLGTREDKANAHRACATVNACAGIPTQALEDGVVKEMREALTNIVLQHDAGRALTEELELKPARAALDKADEEVEKVRDRPIVKEGNRRKCTWFETTCSFADSENRCMKRGRCRYKAEKEVGHGQ
ncbi:hypothetical protein LCGC14_1099140 [marine sediment metagenome]|uniref:Uncharacterized protein n=1 Tax=marine sediment metagenome TaxID=412755 RepID=A0A0F9PT26_9ZZZZ